MVSKIINLLVVGIVLYIVYFIAGLIVSALGLPSVVLMLIGILLLLVLVIKIMEAFDIKL